MMRATLTTDASYCELTRAAGWAAWAESERGRFFGGNALPGSFSCVNSIEMRAIVLGLRLALARGVIAAGDHIVVQTDSMHAAARLQPTYTTARARRRERRGLGPPAQHHRADVGSPRRAFLDMVTEHGLTCEIVRSGAGEHMRHVDRFARACMLEERAARQGASIEAAHLATFEAGLQNARREYVRKLEKAAS